MRGVANDALVPSALGAVKLAEAAMAFAWRSTGEVGDELFVRFGLRSEGPFEDVPAISTTILRFVVPLPGDVFGTWSTFDGQFVGIGLQLYNSMRPDDPTTRLGYEQIHPLLVERFGQLADAWGDQDIPSRAWNMGEWVATMHLFRLRHSSVMLSVERASIAERAEQDRRVGHQLSYSSFWNIVRV